MATIRCENCNCRIGFMSFRKKAYILVDADTGLRHTFCSPRCSDSWSNQHGYSTDQRINKWSRMPPRLESAGYVFEGGKCMTERGDFEPDSPNRFICPGCGERATAQNGYHCPSCGRFVHRDCVRLGFISWYCPVCDVGLIGQS